LGQRPIQIGPNLISGEANVDRFGKMHSNDPAVVGTLVRSSIRRSQSGTLLQLEELRQLNQDQDLSGHHSLCDRIHCHHHHRRRHYHSIASYSFPVIELSLADLIGMI